MPDHFVRRDIVGCVVNTSQILACVGMRGIGFVQPGRAIFAGFEWIEYGRQQLVIDFDQTERFLGDSWGLSGDEGDPISYVAHATVKQIGIIGRHLHIGLAGGAMATRGRSSWVRTAWTPGSASALLLSIWRMLACACGECRIRACSILGCSNSAA